MTTLANVRAALRRVLEDTDATAYLWPDAELDGYLRTTLEGYSRLVPREVRETIAPSGTAAYTPASTPLRILGVEYPDGTPVANAASPNSRVLTALTWFAHAGGVRFSRSLAAGSGNIVLWYAARWPFPGADGTDFGVTPDGDDYLVWGAAVLALGRRLTASAKRRNAAGGESSALVQARQTFATLRRRVAGVRSSILTLAE